MPHTCGEEGTGIRVTGNRKASDCVTVKPAPAMTLSVSRLTWHPPPSGGHTVASSIRWARRRPGVSGLDMFHEAELAPRAHHPVYFPQCRALIGQRAQDQGRHGRVKGTVGRGEPFGDPVLDLR